MQAALRQRAFSKRHWAVILTIVCALVASALMAPATVEAQVDAETPDCSDYVLHPWMNSDLSPSERARLLLDASSLEQKMRWLDEQAAAEPERTEWRAAFTDGDPVIYPAQVPCTPGIRFVNGPQGVNPNAFEDPDTTAFPVPIAEAAAWNPELSYEKGRFMAAEATITGHNVILGPGLAGGRTPLSGRTNEYYGEDPVLAGVLAAQNVLGIEEGNADSPVVANLKHYVANEQETDRDMSSSNVDERTRRQIYDLSFEIAVRESDPGSIMCSYNQINGTYACENPILQDVLKDEIGFEGFIMSDFGAVTSTAPSLLAGLDMELNRPRYFAPEYLHAALDAGEITEEQIDAAAFRVVRAFIDVGLFDHPLPDVLEGVDATTPESRALAQRMAEEGSVLLKNDALLPIADDPGLTLAVVGPTAIDRDDPAFAGGVSAFDVCTAWLPFGPGFPAVPCDTMVSPLEGIEARASGTVVYDDGSDLASAAATAADADIAIVFGYIKQGEFTDHGLTLDGDGDSLIAAVAAANPNTIVVSQVGSAYLMPWLDDVKAVLHTWFPGQEMGTAIARLLFGDVNPSGKLPMSFPASLDDLPTAGSEAQYPGIVDESGFRQVDYSEGMAVGYRWYESEDIDPLFAFGHGLSYTTFDYSRLRVTPWLSSGERDIRVKFRVKNTGDVAGEEVAQVYVDLPSSAGEPWKRLVAWEKIELEPGERKWVTITLSRADLENRHLLQYWDADAEDWVTPRGRYTFYVGGASDDLELEDRIFVWNWRRGRLR